MHFETLIEVHKKSASSCFCDAVLPNMADPLDEENQLPHYTRQSRELNGTERECAFLMLKSMVEGGKLSHGVIAKMA